MRHRLRLGAGKRGTAVSEDENLTAEEQKERPLSIAEMYAQLVYAGHRLEDIASWDDEQLGKIVCRPRDRYGDLKRGEKLPPWVEVDDRGMRVVTKPAPLESAVKGAYLHHGVNEEDAAEKWRKFLDDNPDFGKSGHHKNPNRRPLRRGKHDFEEGH